jgi:hypothetical protein
VTDVATHVVADDAARFHTCMVCNVTDGLVYVQLHEATALPANDAVPFAVVNVAAYGQSSITYPGGRPLQGVVAAVSSTQGTLTLSASEVMLDVTYD